jgi:hypothetical protein
VFGLEAALFAIAAVMAARLGRTRRVTMERAPQLQVAGAE